MPEIKFVYLNGRSEELTLQADGYYHVPLTWRYILPVGVVLDDILKAAGFKHVRRPPGVDYELWSLPELEL